MMRYFAAGSLALALWGCTAAQTTQVQSTAGQVDTALQSACTDALLVANIAGLVPGVGAIIPYINAGCATADGIAKLAADPTSAAWLGQLTGEIKQLAAAAGLKLP